MSCRFCDAKTMYLSPEVSFCQGCGVGYSNREFDSKIYNNAYSERFAKQGETDIGKRLNLWRLGLVASYLPLNSKIIDFGCGAGDFIFVARKFYTLAGVEANAGSAYLARRRDQTVYTFSDFKSYPVDCFTFFDSLEHIPDVETTFSLVTEELAIGGLVVISTPQVRDGVSEHWFSTWRHNRPDEHLTYFSLDGLKYFLGRHGFGVLYDTNQESVLRFDPYNYERNIMTVVARKL